MQRQTTSPVSFNRTTRMDRGIAMTSIRAAQVYPIAYMPVLRGDTASGQATISAELAEMPKPLENAVTMNVQAWFVPKSAHPQFPGYDEFMHSYNGDDIKSLGAADRTPPAFYNTLTGADLTTLDASDFYRTLGIHLKTGTDVNTDLIDAFNLIYNFRLAAHSTKLTRRDYASENLANSVALPKAFWPTGHFSHIVPDYERALVVGNLDLDVQAGSLPIEGLWRQNGPSAHGTATYDEDGTVGTGINNRFMLLSDQQGTTPMTNIFANLSGQTIPATLADIDKARTSQAFAKLRAAYQGNDATGFANDRTIIAELMQGFAVPPEMFKRPWLLDQQRVTFGMAERHATDAANLEDSVTLGEAAANLSLNLPNQDVGGIIMITAEIVPERLDERQGDPWLHITDVATLPNALRDIQRPEPVDDVPAYRIDARHTTPDVIYGYEPMNNVWQRSYTRLGGEFYQADPANPFTEARTGIWQTSLQDPAYTEDHWLCPASFPHNVFADTTGDCCQLVIRHDLTVSGLTQIGDVLNEDNNEYADTAA